MLSNCVTHIQITSNETINIFSIFAPSKCNTPKIIYYKQLKEYLNNYRDQILFLGGDFNYVESKQDKQNNLTYYDKIIPNFFDPKNLYLIDPYKEVYKNQINLTHTLSRIDRIYIPKSLIHNLVSFNHLSQIADHKAILLDLKLKNFEPWGNFYWKLEIK